MATRRTALRNVRARAKTTKGGRGPINKRAAYRKVVKSKKKCF